MARFLGISFTSIGLCIACTPVQAQNTLDTITVFADEEDVPQTGDVVHDEFTGSHNRINTTELVRGDVTVADVLVREAGVQGRQIGGFGSFSSVTVRAASAAQTNVYLDGILLNSGGKAVIDLSMLDLFSLGSIDIYRGFTPLQLGHAGIGGAINLKTLPMSEQTSTQMLLGVGSFGTRRLQLTDSRRWNQLEWTSGFSLQRSDNDFAFLDDNATSFNPTDDTRQKRNNAQIKRLSGLLKAAYQWSGTQRSELLVQATAREQGVPEWRNNPENQASFDSDAWRIQWKQTIDDVIGWNTRHSLYAHRDNDRFDDQLGQVGLGEQDSRAVSNVHGINTYWERVSEHQTVGFNADIKRDTYQIDDRLDASAYRDAKRESLNAVFQWHRWLQEERLLLSPALRFQSIHNRFNRRRDDEAETSADNVLSPQLGLHYQWTDSLNLRANAGRFFRPPAFNELFGNTGLGLGNSDLQPEHGSNADLGVDWQADDTLAFKFSLFASWRDELIATVCDSRQVCRAINTGRARVVGIELGADWALTDALNAKINLTLQDARSLNEFAAINGQQLPGQAQQNLYTRLQYKVGSWRAFLENTGLWDRYYDQANKLPAKDQWIHNVGIDWQKNDWRLSVSINNVGDQQAEDFRGFPRPGRAFNLSLSHRL